MNSYQPELDAALEAANLASRLLRELYERFEAIPDAPASISTDADRRSQDTILGFLSKHFPHDALCAEEQTTTLAAAAHTGTRLWIVDPIDGTRGFARKNGEFSVMVAFAEQGRIVVGVVQEPAIDRLTYAVRGGGGWQRTGAATAAVSCRVGTARKLDASTLVQSRSRPGKTSRGVLALKPARVIETYSAGVKLALVARGEADVYVNDYPSFHDWDVAAGHILVEEAGGRVTGLSGQELRYGLEGAVQAHGLLATNGALHDLALAALAPSPP